MKSYQFVYISMHLIAPLHGVLRLSIYCRLNAQALYLCFSWNSAPMSQNFISAYCSQDSDPELYLVFGIVADIRLKLYCVIVTI